MDTTTFPWDPKAVLGFFNPKALSFTCMAAKDSSEIRCCKPLSQPKKDAILSTLSDLSATKPANQQSDNDKLYKVANNAFCTDHESDKRKGNAVAQWQGSLNGARAALVAACASHAKIDHLASMGIGKDARTGSVGGSDTDPPSGSDEDSSDDDDDDDDDDNDSESTASDTESDAEVERLRELLEQSRLENQNLRSQLRRQRR